MAHKIRKEFFSIVNCVYCKKLLMFGLRCQQCGIKFHESCSTKVSPICRTKKFNKKYENLELNSINNNENIKRTNSEPDRINTINLPSKITDDNNDERNNEKNSSPIDQNENENAFFSNLQMYRDSLCDWEIPESEIIMKEFIGSGSFGSVYRGFWHGEVALKKLKVVEPTKEQLMVSR